MTKDGRPCIVQPTVLPTPGNPGAPPEPNYEGTANVSFTVDKGLNDDVIPDDEVPSIKKAKLDEDKGQDAGSSRATCMMLAQELYPNKGEGSILTEAGDFSKTGKKVKCPSMCSELTNNKMQLFGPSKDANNKKYNKIYTSDSSVCAAAIQAGVIDGMLGGDVILHLTKDSDEGYASKTDFNITSNEGNGNGIAF